MSELYTHLKQELPKNDDQDEDSEEKWRRWSGLELETPRTLDNLQRLNNVATKML